MMTHSESEEVFEEEMNFVDTVDLATSMFRIRFETIETKHNSSN